MSGAAAAAEAERRRKQEEEEMTAPYGDESAQYEYKIIRSATGGFKNPAWFKTILEEEARAGWELLEKFDDSRVRLRRDVKWRERDATLSQDPYRIRVGVSEGVVVVWILLGMLIGIPALVGAIIAVVATVVR
jgi:hypothetical protein